MASTTPNGKKTKPRSEKFVAKSIPIEDLLEPLRPARETMDEVKLQDLIDSLSAVGLIEPLVVMPEGKKYRIYAGHRRFLAAKALGWSHVNCVIRSGADPGDEAITDHENAFREDLNPAEESRYYSHLLETKCSGDVDLLCARVRRSRAHVEGRILLSSGDQQVFDNLSAQRIQIGVAVELNKVNDAGLRLVYLDAAVRGGASVALVREWRIKANAMYGENLPDLADQPLTGVAAPIAPKLDMGCFFCGSDEHLYMMELLYLHKFCRQAIERIMDAKANAPALQKEE